MTAIDPPDSLPDDGAGNLPLADPKAGHVRAASVEDLKTLLKALELEKVDYLLIGGYALYALGYQRGTTDIDVLMRPTREQGERAQRALLLLPGKVGEKFGPRLVPGGRNHSRSRCVCGGRDVQCLRRKL